MTRRSLARADLPLIEWGDQLRAARRARRKLGRRLSLGCFGLALLIGTIAVPPAPRLVWNASASAPIGLYAVSPSGHPVSGDLVVARLSPAARAFAARRHYLPASVPVVKRVAARQGDVVCAFGEHISINGQRAAERRPVDARGRSMPWWGGCRVLRDGQYFLLMAAVPDSFDGRYFCITKARDMIGRAHLLWSR